jgi:hypothetical protein
MTQHPLWQSSPVSQLAPHVFGPIDPSPRQIESEQQSA